MERKLNYLNVIPVYGDNLDFTASEIRRQYTNVGVKRFALCLSFHPEGFPAIDNARNIISATKNLLEKLADCPAEIGVLFQSFLGHGWSGKKPLTDEPWQRTVLVDGQVTPRMCPTDKRFRDYVLFCVEEIMKLNPAFLLVDDDFGMRYKECLCPAHIAMFNKASGKNYGFKELSDILQNQPLDNPDAMLFAQQRADLIVGFAKEIRAVIDRYNPSLKCIMCTPGNGHGFVNEVIHALAGEHGEPATRIDNATYGNRPVDVLLWCAVKTMRAINQYQNVPDIIAEADTFPQTYYSESAAMFHAHLTNDILCGITGAKLWMSEFEQPTDNGTQSKYEKSFHDHQGFYNELFRTVQNGISWEGIKTAYVKSNVLNHPLSTSPENIFYPNWLSEIIGPFSIPFAVDDGSKDGIYSLVGKDVALMDDATLNSLFSKKLLIDSSAAKALTARGYGKLMGVQTVEDPDFFSKGEYGDGMPAMTGLMWEQGIEKLETTSENVHVQTWCCEGIFRTKDITKLSPCMTFFTNSLGGKVAVTAWPVGLSSYKRDRNVRRTLVLQALDFLAGGMLDMTVELKDRQLVRYGTCADGSKLLAIITSNLDNAPAIPLRCSRIPGSIRKLQDNGSWLPVGFSYQNGMLTIQQPIAPLATSIFKIN